MGSFPVKLHPVNPEKLVHIFEHMGFERVRQKGSHELLRHPDGRTVTIPLHGGADISTGLLEHMLRNIGMRPTRNSWRHSGTTTPATTDRLLLLRIVLSAGLAHLNPLAALVL